MRAHIGSLMVVVFVFATLIWGRAAQSDRGAIAGTIKDTSGAVIPRVSVEATGPIVRTAVSDERGAFRIADLIPGDYTVTATLPGFNVESARVTVAAHIEITLAVEMHVGSLAETITVTGPTPRVDALGSARQVIVGGKAARREAAVTNIAPPMPAERRSRERFNTESYEHVVDNAFKVVASDPLSTFSVDVDTASYANVRRFLNEGRLPEPGAVRVEELINYFRLPYAAPEGDEPFSITTELSACPWNPDHRLALIGIQGRQLPPREPAPRNLVFLLDVSGSMMPADKLPLVQSAMRMLVDALNEQDRVAIVVYAGASGLALPSTPGSDKAAIARAIADLRPGGSTNGAEGIQLAYRIAREHFIRGGVNRVVLATDGDFNVGVTSQDALVRLIEHERESGVFLSVLGVGTGNLKDSTMEKLADKGNGNYAYLDSLHEARKVLVHELGGTLETIAKDVKIQVEFNPSTVDGYRLIGYENRVMAHEDFNDDTKDAGDIGAGHSVTALYEIVPKGEHTPGTPRTPLKYQQAPRTTAAARTNELMTVAVRFKQPDGDRSSRVAKTVFDTSRPMTANLGFASAVAEFGMLLRGAEHAERASYAAVIDRARRYSGDDRHGYQAEFIGLAERAAQLAQPANNAGRAGAIWQTGLTPVRD
jgi:Ca-activated chloride channel family protein